MKKSKYLSFETERLEIRPTSERDAAFIFKLLNSPKWLKYIGNRNINSEADAKAYIQTKMIPQLERLGFSNYTVIRKSDQTKIGTCGLYDREGLEGVDIGFAFLPSYEKQGYAFEAATKIKEAAGKHFNIEKISGITLEENIASRKLLEKLGLQFSKYTKIPNDDEELMLYTTSEE